MRLIDSDELLQEFTLGDDAWYKGRTIEGCIRKAPTIDAVPVVRCRECRWYDAGKNDSESWSDCTLRYGKHFNVSPMDFCSYGQRKEAGHD